MTEERDTTFDRMKGLAIILMVVGHLTDTCRELIFSFHMPLFFIIAGYFFNPRPVWPTVKKDASRLLWPYLVLGALPILLIVVRSFTIIPSSQTLSSRISALIWGVGWHHRSLYFGKVPAIGTLWFLLALFWTRTFFNLICKYFRSAWLIGLVSAVCTFAAIWLDNTLINLPLGVLTGMTALLFYYSGWALRRVSGFKRMNIWLALLCLAVWCAALNWSALEMAVVYYGDYASLSMAGALAATLMLYWILSKFRLPWLDYCGRISLSILSAHYLLAACGANKLYSYSSDAVKMGIEFVLIAILVILMSQIPLFQKALGLRRISIKGIFRGILPRFN
ncbi:MAG: acyltransferase family protein [Muribaculaceae bacterium]|nr:acyltransferase family protein [Muribaculaceae bacterium]